MPLMWSCTTSTSSLKVGKEGEPRLGQGGLGVLGLQAVASVPGGQERILGPQGSASSPAGPHLQ